MDDRPLDVQAADLMDELALFEKQFAAPRPEPAEVQPEPAPETELE